MKRRDRERGAAAVEFAMLIPALLIILLGAIHFGRAFAARHRLGEATAYAARGAALQRNAGLADQLLRQRMAGADCTQISVGAQQMGSDAYKYLQVSASCTLPIPLGSALLGNLGLADVRVTATMPMD